MASPAATTRTASASAWAEASLSTKPLAPARSASYTYSSRSKVVTTSTLGPLEASVHRSAGGGVQWWPTAIRRVASSPFRTGMRTSMTTTSGRSSAALSTASWPLTASPTTSMSGWAPSSTEKPSRTMA